MEQEVAIVIVYYSVVSCIIVIARRRSSYVYTEKLMLENLAKKNGDEGKSWAVLPSQSLPSEAKGK